MMHKGDSEAVRILFLTQSSFFSFKTEQDMMEEADSSPENISSNEKEIIPFFTITHHQHPPLSTRMESQQLTVQHFLP